MSTNGPQETEDSLRQEVTRLRAMVEAIPNAIVLVHFSGRIELVNSQTEKLFGYTRKELTGSLLEGLVPERYHASLAGLRSLFELKGAVPEDLGRDLYARRKDGTEFPVEIALNPIETDQGRMVLFTVVDLSARKALEDHLRQVSGQLAGESEQRLQMEIDLEQSREGFRYLFLRNPLPMWVYEVGTMRFLEVNRAAMAQYGYSREEFLSMSVFDIRTSEEAVRLREHLKINRSPEHERTLNWQHRTKAGQLIEADIFSHAILFEGKPSRLVVAVNVTERNAAEAQLRQSQKMEAVGQLTGGVAHDFNNLLTIILGNLEMISEHATGDPVIQEMVEDALASVGRGSRLTQRLLAYARQQPLEPKIVDVRNLVASMTELFRRSLGEAIQIRQHLPLSLWKTRADPSQLENALLNLAVNARDAMSRGGILTIEGQNVALDRHYADRNTEVTPGDYVMLAISDTGSGISKEILDRVLEPFFTTKPIGKGSGLGLSMVYGFVKQSGGHLKIYSEPSRGTTIKIFLPRSDGSEDTPEAAAETEAIPHSRRGEVILVVEDDLNIRKLVQRVLTGLGYQTLVAEDGSTALAILEKAPSIDLLFSDVVLPGGMSGVELAEEVKSHHPDLKVLLMSGYTRNALKEVGEDDSIHLLTKPFRKEDLARTLHHILNTE